MCNESHRSYQFLPMITNYYCFVSLPYLRFSLQELIEFSLKTDKNTEKIYLIFSSKSSNTSFQKVEKLGIENYKVEETAVAPSTTMHSAYINSRSKERV